MSKTPTSRGNRTQKGPPGSRASLPPTGASLAPPPQRAPLLHTALPAARGTGEVTAGMNTDRLWSFSPLWKPCEGGDVLHCSSHLEQGANPLPRANHRRFGLWRAALHSALAGESSCRGDGSTGRLRLSTTCYRAAGRSRLWLRALHGSQQALGKYLLSESLGTQTEVGEVKGIPAGEGGRMGAQPPSLESCQPAHVSCTRSRGTFPGKRETSERAHAMSGENWTDRALSRTALPRTLLWFSKAASGYYCG